MIFRDVRGWSRAATLALLVLVGSAADTVRAQVPVEIVRFNTSDGVEIVGDYFPPDVVPAPAVVLVPMLRTDRSSWSALTPELHKAHFAVLSIDLRGYGDSGAPRADELHRRVREKDTAVFQEMNRDVEAAVAWLLARLEVDKTRIGLVGADVGWSVALDYAVDDPSVDAIVGLTPQRGTLGIDSMTGTLMYGKRPMLLLAVETDRPTIERLARMNPAVVTEIVGTGSGHGTRMLSHYTGLPARIARFLSANLSKHEGKPVAFELGDKTYFKSTNELRVKKPEVAPRRIRWFSSAEEAKERGFKPAS